VARRAEEVLMIGIRTLTARAAVVLAAAGAPAAAQHEPHHQVGPAEQLGTVSFPTSCAAGAQRTFERALALLHSFEYDQAEPAFERAAAADPTCAMAHWGVAMSRLHPLWAPPTPADLRAGLDAVARAESLGAPTGRERGYVEAIGAFYREHERVGHLARLARYEAAWGRLAAEQPEDAEAQIFHALALVAVATVSPPDSALALQRRAGAILEPHLARQPRHPGLAHYIIHAYDTPPLAPRALAAARRYAAIAPSSPHAQHMPSHIFTRVGLWDESEPSNRRSARAALAVERSQRAPSQDYLHALDYLEFAYLQQGRDADARRVVEQAARADTLGPSAPFQSLYALAVVPARYALERGDWGAAARLPLRPTPSYLPAEAARRFARGIGAARSGDTVLARAEAAALAVLRDSLALDRDPRWVGDAEIGRLAIEAWVARAAGDTTAAARLADSAAALEDVTEKHPVTPGRILSARTLQGELLLELNRPVEARRAFELALAREPGRVRALFGAARAAEAAGDSAAARERYREVVALMTRADASRPEPRRARAFLAGRRGAVRRASDETSSRASSGAASPARLPDPRATPPTGSQ
jgi:tetratricopeptide (TPR) repeat protein